MPSGRRAGIPLLFGRRVRALRKLRKLTQEQLGELANVTGKLVGQIERGAGNPTLEVIAGLAKALSVELPMLMQFEEDQPTGSGEHAAGKVAASERVMRFLADHPATEIELALRILEAALSDK